MNYLNVIRNNWKKCAFGSAALSYGAYSLKNHYEVTSHMRSVCKEVLTLAESSTGQPKTVLVIMNPVANKKKSEKMFKKYCEPILHLAGYSVDIVKTNFVGHAKTVIENLKVLPDAIVVAGGDGTSSEVVTGLMRRSGPKCPIVLVPLGKTNKTAFKYANFDPKKEVDYLKALPNSILPMVYNKVRYANVIKFDVIKNNEDDKNNTVEQKKPKPIYGLNEFSWGLLRDIESVQDKYWYFGGFRHYAAALLNSFSKNLNWHFSTDFEASPPCPGCRNCVAESEKKLSKLYLRRLLPIQTSKENSRSLITNEACNTFTQGNITTSQLNIVCKRNADAYYELEAQASNSFNPGWDFIKNVVDVANDNIQPSFVLKSRTIQLMPTTAEENTTYYSIDGEEYDVRPIKLSLLPNAITIFS